MMRTRLSAIVVACGLAVMAACSGGGSGSPTSPTAPLPVNDPEITCPAQGFELWDTASEGTIDFTVGDPVGNTIGTWATYLAVELSSNHWPFSFSISENGHVITSQTIATPPVASANWAAGTVLYQFPSIPPAGTVITSAGTNGYTFVLGCAPGSTTQ